MELDPYLTPHTKWTKNLRVRTEAKLLLEENINLCDHGLGNSLLDTTAKTQATRTTKIDKLEAIQVKMSCASKDNPEWEKIEYL